MRARSSLQLYHVRRNLQTTTSAPTERKLWEDQPQDARSVATHICSLARFLIVHCGSRLLNCRTDSAIVARAACVCWSATSLCVCSIYQHPVRCYVLFYCVLLDSLPTARWQATDKVFSMCVCDSVFTKPFRTDCISVLSNCALSTCV